MTTPESIPRVLVPRPPSPDPRVLVIPAGVRKHWKYSKCKNNKRQAKTKCFEFPTADV
jgi:hypothetical protein